MEFEPKKRKVGDEGKGSKYQTSLEFLALLLKTKAEDFAIDKPKKDAPIFVCYKSDKVIDVWKGLVKHNFLSCPVILKDESKYYGFIDLVDIVRYVMEHFGSSGLDEEKDFWQLVDEEKSFSQRTVDELMTYPLSRRNPFHPVREGYSALAVLELLAREEHLHRVPVIDTERHMCNLVTQSQVISFIQENISKVGEIKNKPVNDCESFFKSVVSVQEDALAIDAFNLMVDKNVSGVAVCNVQGHLLANLSLRDMKLISHDARLFWRLKQNVSSFLAKLKAEWQSKHARPHSVVSVTKEHTLEDVIKLLAQHHIHRVYVVDSANKPIGVASLKDVLLEMLAL